jgi:hypothetical protein
MFEELSGFDLDRTFLEIYAANRQGYTLTYS